MNDPLQVLEKPRNDDSYMDSNDFEMLGDRLAERYLERPALTLNVVFCFSNPGRADRYQTLTEMLTLVWARAIAAGGECVSVGIKWGGFMVFLAACNTGTPWSSPTFAEAFETLENRIGEGLKAAHESDVAFYRP
jgi:hypothetical protein